MLLQVPAPKALASTPEERVPVGPQPLVQNMLKHKRTHTHTHLHPDPLLYIQPNCIQRALNAYASIALLLLLLLQLYPMLIALSNVAMQLHAAFPPCQSSTEYGAGVTCCQDTHHDLALCTEPCEPKYMLM